MVKAALVQPQVLGIAPPWQIGIGRYRDFAGVILRHPRGHAIHRLGQRQSLKAVFDTKRKHSRRLNRP